MVCWVVHVRYLKTCRLCTITGHGILVFCCHMYIEEQLFDLLLHTGHILVSKTKTQFLLCGTCSGVLNSIQQLKVEPRPLCV
jgi:hypothetical protein